MIASAELFNGLMKTVKQPMQLIVMVKTGKSLECVWQRDASVLVNMCAWCVHILYQDQIMKLTSYQHHA